MDCLGDGQDELLSLLYIVFVNGFHVRTNGLGFYGK